MYDAVSHFNYGGQSVIDTLKLLNINAGTYTTMMANKINVTRKYNAGYKSKPVVRQTRKIKRGLKRKKTDKILKKEGVTYESGGFH